MGYGLFRKLETKTTTISNKEGSKNGESVIWIDLRTKANTAQSKKQKKPAIKTKANFESNKKPSVNGKTINGTRTVTAASKKKLSFGMYERRNSVIFFMGFILLLYTPLKQIFLEFLKITVPSPNFSPSLSFLEL